MPVLDSLHSALFYALAAVAVAGGLAAALLAGRARAYGTPVASLAAAGAMLDLGAWPGAAAMVVMAAGAFLLLRDAREQLEPPNQAAGALAGIAFLVLAYVAYRSGYANANSVGIVQVLVTGAFLFATGLYLAGRNASFASALRGLPMMAAGAGLDLSGAARFEAGWVGYEVFAAILAAGALAFLATGRWLLLPETAR